MATAATTLVSLGEWDGVERTDLHLVTDRDRLLADSLRDGKERLLVEEMREGLRIRSRSWVGVVRFSSFEIRVTPKYVGGSLGVLQMLAHTRALDALRRAPAVRDLAVRGAHLFDLVALLLAESADVISRDGLLQDYVVREDTLSVVKGRLLPLDQVSRHPGRVDVLECRYDEFETDIDENRLVAAALGAVGRHSRHPQVRTRVNRVRTVFADACDANLLDPAWITEPVEYHRRNEHYRDAHLLSRLVLEQLGVRDVYAPGDATSFAFLFDMNQLFEDFVTWLVRSRLRRTEAVVEAQAVNRLVFRDALTGRSYASVRPDVLVYWVDADGVDRHLPIDAKYKLYGDSKVEQPDLYQLFVYAYAYSAREADDPAPAYLLYPSIGDRRRSIRIDDPAGKRGAVIHARGIDLVQLLDALDRGQKVRVGALDEIAELVGGLSRTASIDGGGAAST